MDGVISSIIRADAQELLADTEDIRDRLEGTEILIAGAGGFLGAYLLDILAAWIAEGTLRCSVTAVDNFVSGVPERLEHLAGESLLKALSHVLREPFRLSRGTDWILHMASIASPTFYRRYPLETIDVNVQGTRRLLDLCRNGCHGMLYLSSSEIYGDPEPEAIPTPEDY